MIRYRFALPALLLIPCAALATDGVFEINQAKVLASGGFPYVIAQSGSYRLTSDLDVRVLGLPNSTNTNAIEIWGAIGVTLDLNGFTIFGPAQCSPACSNTGTGKGVQVAGYAADVTIRNGRVIGAGGWGLDVEAGSALVEDVQVSHCGGFGIYVGYGNVIRSTARSNGIDGISVFDGVIRDSFAINNNGKEISLNYGTIDACAVENTGASEPAIRLNYGVLRGTHVKTGNAKAVTCNGVCGLSGNVFSECTNTAGCLEGVLYYQLPPSSNICHDTVCVIP
jgi:hypothetical protein